MNTQDKPEIQTAMDFVMRKFRSQISYDDRDDLRQDMWQAYLSWDGNGELQALFRNTARTFIAGRRRDTKYYPIEPLADSDKCVDPFVLTADKLDIARALDCLSPLEREVVELFMNGLNKRAIGKQMGRGKVWVWYTMRGAFNKLKEELGEDYTCQSK